MGYIFYIVNSRHVTYLLTPCSRVVLEKLTGLKPLKKLSATCAYPEPARSGPCHHNPLPEDPS